jgi:site-specific recombinase XerD
MGNVVSILDPQLRHKAVARVAREDDHHRITSTIWRRHAAGCKEVARGRNSINCGCPLWGDGYVNGERVLRKSLDTRNMRIARNRIAGLLEDYLDSTCPEEPSVPEVAPAPQVATAAVGVPTVAVPVESASNVIPLEVADDNPGLIRNAAKAYLANCATNGVGASTISKYRNSLNKLAEFTERDEICLKQKIRTVADFRVIDLDRFRAGRQIVPITSSKELECIRAFWAFCAARDLCPKNIAALIKGPKIVEQNNVVPYTPEEMNAIIDACAKFGQHDYERKRARAVVLILRHTALRISDVALMRRDRISRTATGWRIFVRTTKNHELVYLLVPDELVEALNALPAPRGSNKDCPFLFWNGKSKQKSQISEVSETLAAVFRKSGVQDAGAHRYRHTLATELVGIGASFEDVADVLGNSPAIVRKHYAKFSKQRQARIDNFIQKVHEDAWKR